MKEKCSASAAFLDLLNTSIGLPYTKNSDKFLEIDTFDKASLTTNSTTTIPIPKLQAIPIKSVYSKFTSLRLNDLNITSLGKDTKLFTELLELSLTGNLLNQIDQSELPKKLEILHLYANSFTEFPALNKCNNLIHVGLGFNLIRFLKADQCVFPSNLKSLDLSFNNLENIAAILESLKSIKNLSNLVLLGNPVCLGQDYRLKTIYSIPSLKILDDIPVVSQEEARIPNMTEEKCKILFEMQNITNLPPSQKLPQEANDKPADEYRWCIEFVLHGFNDYLVTSPALESQEDGILTFNFKKAVVFPVDCALKKAINQGISVKLIRKRVGYCPIINEKEGEVEVEPKNGKKAPLKKVEKKAKKVTAVDINPEEWEIVEKEKQEVFTKLVSTSCFLQGQNKLEENPEIVVPTEFIEQAPKKGEKKKPAPKLKKGEIAEAEVVEPTRMHCMIELGGICELEVEI